MPLSSCYSGVEAFSRLGGATTATQVQRHIIRLGIHQIPVHAAIQVDLGLEIQIHLPDVAYICGLRPALLALSDLFDGVAQGHGPVLLERHGSMGADLLIFRGAAFPFGFSEYKELRSGVQRHLCPDTATLTYRPDSPDDWHDSRWKYDNTLTVRLHGNAVLVSGSPLGLRMCALQSNRIANLRRGHAHIDWFCTSKSAELCIEYTGNA